MNQEETKRPDITRMSRRLLHISAFVNLAFFALTVLIARPDERFFMTLAWIGLIQVAVSITLVIAAVRIKRANSHGLAIGMMAIMACVYSLVPFVAAGIGKYRRAPEFAVAHIALAAFWWFAAITVMRQTNRGGDESILTRPIFVTGAAPVIFATTTKTMPPALAARIRMFNRASKILFLPILIFPLIGLGISYGILNLSEVALRRTTILCYLIVFGGAFIVFCIRLSRVHAIRRELRDQNYAKCLNCGYDLSGLPADHLCPECGKAYQILYVQGVWRRWFEGER